MMTPIGDLATNGHGLLRVLRERDDPPCSRACAWLAANGNRSLGWLWMHCPNSGWMIWMMTRFAFPSHDEQWRSGALLMVARARTAMLYVGRGTTDQQQRAFIRQWMTDW